MPDPKAEGLAEKKAAVAKLTAKIKEMSQRVAKIKAAASGADASVVELDSVK